MLSTYQQIRATLADTTARSEQGHDSFVCQQASTATNKEEAILLTEFTIPITQELHHEITVGSHIGVECVLRKISAALSQQLIASVTEKLKNKNKQDLDEITCEANLRLPHESPASIALFANLLELIKNAITAEATQLTLKIIDSPQSLTIEIRDNGTRNKGLKEKLPAGQTRVEYNENQRGISTATGKLGGKGIALSDITRYLKSSAHQGAAFIVLDPATKRAHLELSSPKIKGHEYVDFQRQLQEPATHSTPTLLAPPAMGNLFAKRLNKNIVVSTHTTEAKISIQQSSHTPSDGLRS